MTQDTHRPRFALSIVFAAILLAQCAPDAASPELSDQARLAEAGKILAEQICANCHAVGIEGESPHADAPPFRQIGWGYDVRLLEESLAEGIVVGHPDMPVFRFEPDEIDALLTYMESVQVPRET